MVVWIGFLQWHFRTQGGAPAEPILKNFRTIKAMDAVVAYASRDLARDEKGRPLSHTAADGDQRAIWHYTNPRRPPWPDAGYIVGNPPFVGQGY